MKQLVIIVGLIVPCTWSLHLANDKSFIDEINNEKSTWTAEESERFIDFSMESVQGLMGTFDTPKEMKEQLKKKIEVRADLPENFYLREQYPNC